MSNIRGGGSYLEYKISFCYCKIKSTGIWIVGAATKTAKLVKTVTKAF